MPFESGVKEHESRHEISSHQNSLGQKYERTNSNVEAWEIHILKKKSNKNTQLVLDLGIG